MDATVPALPPRHLDITKKNTLQREIKYFVETNLCKLCVVLRSHVLRVVCPHQGYRSATPIATTV